MKDIINKILHGDALTKLKELDSESVDCIITSPPYWALRDYKTEGTIWDGKDSNCEHEWNTKNIKWHSKRDYPNCKPSKEVFDDSFQWKGTPSSFCSKCNAWKGELGQEPTIELYINHLVSIFDECKRVLKKEGTCWVVLGDTYVGTGDKKGRSEGKGLDTIITSGKARTQETYNNKKVEGVQSKSLCMIPERFAIKMIENNWVLRNKIVWWKPNCMPSSAKDRFTVDYEYVYFFSKSQKYYFKTQYEPMLTTEEAYNNRRKYNFCYEEYQKENITPINGGTKKQFSNPPNPNCRIKRCVWSIPTKPFPEAHFAVFPEELVKQCLDAGCPPEICIKCKKPRILEEYKTGQIQRRWSTNNHEGSPYNQQSSIQNTYDYKLSDCGCNSGFESGIVLDPFMGSGTTALVALKNNRRFIGIELNGDYIDIALKRLEPHLYQAKLMI